MKVFDRISLIDKIGRELQTRFSYEEIATYLAAFDIKRPDNVTVNSKWVYSKVALRDVPLATISRIVDDLGLGSLTQAAAQILPPENWKGTQNFRLFISHIAKEKKKATRLSETLAPFGIMAFVAHEDIQPTLEWQSEIERALHCMDAFLAIHTVGFSSSIWTQQEIGFAVARGVKIISLRMGEDPTGFISKRQALPRLKRTAEEISREIDRLLLEDPLTRDRLESAKSAPSLSNADDEIPF